MTPRLPLLLVALVALGVIARRAPAQSSSTAAPPPGVLVLYWQSAQYPLNLSLEGALQSEIKRITGGRVRYYSEYVETDHFPTQELDLALRDYLLRKYADARIDVVIASGLATHDFLDRHKARLFPRTPRIFLGNPPWASAEHGPAGTTAIAPYRGYNEHIELVRRLQPDVERIYIVSGTPSRDGSFEKVARADLTARPSAIAVSYLTDLPLNDLIARVRSLPPRSAILFAWQQTLDQRGEVLEPADILSAISGHSAVPIYGMATRVLGSGIVGGNLFTLEAIGTRAAQLAVRILDGESPDAIPVESAPAIPMFDWRALRRWDIPESRLPPGSVIVHRPVTMWDRYSHYILWAAGICAVQAALIIGLLIERASRKRAERSAEARQRELTQLQRVAVMGELSGALAHEIGQPLAAIKMNTRAAHGLLHNARPDLEAVSSALDEIDQANVWAFDVIGRFRQVLRRNNSAHIVLDMNALIADALVLLGHELKARSVIVNTRLATTPPLVAGDRVELQQVVINLVLNACDASAGLPEHARQVTVATAFLDGSVEIAVTDWGGGMNGANADHVFDPFVTTKKDGLGLGLAICRRIIIAHHGQIGVQDHPETGCTFWFRLPLRSAAVPRPRPLFVRRYRSGSTAGRM